VTLVAVVDGGGPTANILRNSVTPVKTNSTKLNLVSTGTYLKRQ